MSRLNASDIGIEADGAEDYLLVAPIEILRCYPASHSHEQRSSSWIWSSKPIGFAIIASHNTTWSVTTVTIINIKWQWGSGSHPFRMASFGFYCWDARLRASLSELVRKRDDLSRATWMSLSNDSGHRLGGPARSNRKITQAMIKLGLSIYGIYNRSKVARTKTDKAQVISLFFLQMGYDSESP